MEFCPFLTRVKMFLDSAVVLISAWENLSCLLHTYFLCCDRDYSAKYIGYAYLCFLEKKSVLFDSFLSSKVCRGEYLGVLQGN